MDKSERKADLTSSSKEASYFEKHTPVYPLPNEILKMARDETVCQFCGVSYLIHNEIKRLEDRIKELEQNLLDYKDLKLRESQFKQVNEENRLKIESMEDKILTMTQMMASVDNDIKSKEIDINSLRAKNQELVNENYTLIAKNENFKTRFIKYESVVKETLLNLSKVKSDFKLVIIDVKDKYQSLKLNLFDFQTKLLKIVKQIGEEYSTKIDELNGLKSTASQLREEKSNSSETLKSYIRQIDALEKLKVELNSKIDALSEESTRTSDIYAKYLTSENKVIDLIQKNSDLKNENQNLKSKSENLNSEINELKVQLNTFDEKMNSVKQNHLKEIKLKSDEVQQLVNEIQSLRRQIEEKEAMEKYFNEFYQSNTSETKVLKTEINHLNQRISEMENERKGLVLAHQCQIAELKDSFKEKLRLNDGLTDQMNFELNKQREKFAREMKEIEASLKENFNAELEISRQKYNEMCLKYQNLSKDFESNSKSRISSLEAEKQRLVQELRNLHEEKVENEEKLRSDLENLRNITKQLHEKLEKYSDDNSQYDFLKLKQEVVQKDQIIIDYEAKIKSMEQLISNQKEEIKILQETVHKECLERDELLENLNSTKDELFIFKKNAYSSNKKLPSIDSLNTSPIKTSEFKRPSIDLNSQMRKYETEQQMMRANSQNGLSSSRQSSLSMANISNSGKSSADSRSKYLDEKSATRNGPTTNNPLSLLTSMNQANSGGEPIQLFKKINQLSSLKNNTSNNQQQQNKNSSSGLMGSSNIDNKKRISLLLSRKS